MCYELRLKNCTNFWFLKEGIWNNLMISCYFMVLTWFKLVCSTWLYQNSMKNSKYLCTTALTNLSYTFFLVYLTCNILEAGQVLFDAFPKAKSAKKLFFLFGNFRPLPNKNVQIWELFFPLLFPKDSESLNILDIRLWEVGEKDVKTVPQKWTHTQTDGQTDRQTDGQIDL